MATLSSALLITYTVEYSKKQKYYILYNHKPPPTRDVETV